MQKRILLSLLLGVIFSISIFSQNLKVEKITLPDSELTNLYKIDSGVYRSEQPSHEDFKALEKYGIGEALNLRNRHSDDDEAAGTNVKLHRVKTKAHSINEEQLIEALRIIKNRKAPIVIHCHHGSDRTGAVCALYRVVFQNVSKEDAIHEMTEGGFGFHRIYKNIIRTIAVPCNIWHMIFYCNRRMQIRNGIIRNRRILCHCSCISI